MTSIRPAMNTAAPKLSLSQAAKQCRGNLWRMTKQSAGDFAENIRGLRSNALILGTLILVVSRIGVSYFSAQSAKGTPEEDFRRREFYRTSTRECFGWLLSYLVYRGVEQAVKRGIIYSFNIDNARKIMRDALTGFWNKLGQSKSPKEFANHLKDALLPKWRPKNSPVIQEIKAFFQRKPTKEFKIVQKEIKDRDFSNLDHPLMNKKWVRRIVNPKNQPNKEALESFYNWFPLIVAAVPAILLSGIGLERFSLYKAEDFVDKLTKRGVQPPTFQARQQNFHYNQFLSSVQQKQMNRFG